VAAIVLLAASSIGREGLETTLFLFAGSTTGASGTSFVLGGLLGFAIAAAIGVGIYQGSSRIPLKPFFLVSGIVVIVLAAGLVTNSIAKLHEAAILTDIGDRPWDMDTTISITSTEGKFLNTLLGYDSAPSTLQIGLYWTYLVAAGVAFVVLPASRRPNPAASTPLPSTPPA
jgi:high-affinity iron transporter